MLKAVLLLGLLVAWYLHRRGFRSTAAAALVIGAGTLMGGLFFMPKTAECAWCPSYTCYARCSSACACVSGPGTGGGQCYSIQHSEYLLSQDGYKELP